MQKIEKTVQITNKRGLHARAASKFVKLTGEYDAEVKVTKDGNTVNGDSIMGLLMLAASPGTSIRIAALGEQAIDVIEALEDLILRRFDEE